MCLIEAKYTDAAQTINHIIQPQSILCNEKSSDEKSKKKKKKSENLSNVNETSTITSYLFRIFCILNGKHERKVKKKKL